MERTNPLQRKPSWLRVRLRTTPAFDEVDTTLRSADLHTVCREARCPNRAECWSDGTATFLILGDTCSRGCRFCAVQTHRGAAKVDDGEPDRVADAAVRLSLRHVVITSVTRDDIPDGGASIFARTIRALTERDASIATEVLTPDYRQGALDTVLQARPKVFAHNVETVRRLSTELRHPRFSYDGSLETLRQASTSDTRSAPAIKSSILLGLGETYEEVLRTMDELREAGVTLLVLGQYLRPSVRQVPVVRYWTPDEFDVLAEAGAARGFAHVMAKPLARTSYRAAHMAEASS